MMVGGEREGVSDCELGRVRAGRTAAAFLPSALPPSHVDSIHFCTARKLYNQKQENKVFELQKFFHIVRTITIAYKFTAYNITEKERNDSELCWAEASK